MEKLKNSMGSKRVNCLIICTGLTLFFLNTSCSLANDTPGGMMDKNNRESEVVKEKFIDLYTQWQRDIDKPDVKISSNSKDYINTKSYKDIISLGRSILPYLIKKMEEGKNNSWNEGQFFLWYAVREISGVNLIKESEKIGEQEKAERYLNWWRNQEKIF